MYFVLNAAKQPLDGWVALRAMTRAVGVFDPMRETKGLATIRKGAGGLTEVYLQLAPGESRILKTYALAPAGEPLPRDNPLDAPRPLAGRWSVRFTTGGPTLPAAAEIDALRSWTEFGDDAARSFAGTAVYTLRFPRPAEAPGLSAWRLDLGRVADSARVTLNGRELGVLLGPLFQLRLDRRDLAAENTLEIAVTNSMTNRVIDLDRRGVNWKRFYNTNLPSKRKENAGPDGLFNAARWPLRESGLLGPVQLTPLAARK